MQTFLPSPDFGESAHVLDDRRLGKQRVECYQIMIALFHGRGWISHPAVAMWRGHEQALLDYSRGMCEEWSNRGFLEQTYPKIQELFFNEAPFIRQRAEPPSWLGDEEFHLSHQSNLIRKDPAFYSPLFPGVPDDLPYVWPISV